MTRHILRMRMCVSCFKNMDDHFQWIHNAVKAPPPFHYNYYRTMQEISPISRLSPTPYKREPRNKANMKLVQAALG